MSENEGDLLNLFSVDIFYIDLVDRGNPHTTTFVNRTHEQMEMFKISDSKSLSVMVIEQVVAFEKAPLISKY